MKATVSKYFDHSKIMYCCSSVQILIVWRNGIVFLLCRKRPTASKYLLFFFHQNRQKQNGSKCNNDNPWTWPLGLYWSLRVKLTLFRVYIESLKISSQEPPIKESKRDDGLFWLYSECTCVDVMYFVPVCTCAYHIERNKTYNGSEQ